MGHQLGEAFTDSMNPSSDRPVLIGWKEYVSFPEWDDCRVKVKMDTGARTSALDALSCDLQESPDGGMMAELRLALSRRHPERVVTIRTPVLRMTTVSNSNGMRERRPVIEALVRLGPVTKRIRLTVTNRRSMLFRMILGRKALEGDFVVDVSRKYVLRGHETTNRTKDTKKRPIKSGEELD